jgi:hypothetical protein
MDTLLVQRTTKNQDLKVELCRVIGESQLLGFEGIFNELLRVQANPVDNSSWTELEDVYIRTVKSINTKV